MITCGEVGRTFLRSPKNNDNRPFFPSRSPSLSHYSTLSVLHHSCVSTLHLMQLSSITASSRSRLSSVSTPPPLGESDTSSSGCGCCPPAIFHIHHLSIHLSHPRYRSDGCHNSYVLGRVASLVSSVFAASRKPGTEQVHTCPKSSPSIVFASDQSTKPVLVRSSIIPQLQLQDVWGMDLEVLLRPMHLDCASVSTAGCYSVLRPLLRLPSTLLLSGFL